MLGKKIVSKVPSFSLREDNLDYSDFQRGGVQRKNKSHSRPGKEGRKKTGWQKIPRE